MSCDVSKSKKMDFSHFEDSSLHENFLCEYMVGVAEKEEASAPGAHAALLRSQGCSWTASS